MKKSFTFFLFLLLTLTLASQQDSITIEYRQEAGELDRLSYIDAYDYLEDRKGSDYEDSWMEVHSRFQLGLAF